MKSKTIRISLAASLCLAPRVCLAQCQIGSELLNSGPVISTIIAPGYSVDSWVVSSVFLVGSCPGITNGSANVKFQFSATLPSTNLLVVSPSSGTTPAMVYVAINPSALTNAYPSGPSTVEVEFTTVDQSPVSTAFTFVNVSLLAPAAPVIQSIVNAASLTPTISPGTLVSILGSNLGPNASPTFGQNGLYPTTVGNSTITFNGTPGAIVSMNQGQIVAQAPYEIAGQNSVQVVLTRYPGTSVTQTSNTFTVPEVDNSLAVFVESLPGGTQPGIQNCTALGCTDNSLENPAPTGSIVTLYASSSGFQSATVPDGGIGLLTQNYSSASLTIGGQPATILYSGVAPLKLWGILQINAVVPSGLASGVQPAVLTIGGLGTASQNVPVVVGQ